MKEIYIPRITIVCLLIILLCISGIGICIININAYHHPTPLSSLTGDDLKSGRYVSGTITSYVISPNKPKSTDSYDYFGNYNNLIDEEYIGFIIPFNEEQYVRAWINNQESLALLNETQDGFHVNVPFVGRIYEWDASQSQLTDDMLGFDHNKVITNYAIVQENLNTEIFWIKVCLSGIMISLLLYSFKGKIEVSTVVYEHKNSQRIPNYVDVSVEIVAVERRISMYEKLERKYRKWSWIGVFCVVIGIYLFVKFGSFSGRVISILLIGYGISKYWIYFINSKNRLAIFIANLFHISTLQMKRMEDCKLLTNLKKKGEI